MGAEPDPENRCKTLSGINSAGSQSPTAFIVNRQRSPLLSHIWEPCPHGWRKITPHCFRYVGTSMSWYDAEKNCRSMGANLASIHDMYYYGEVQRLIRDKTGRADPAWLGGSDEHREGFWWWSDEFSVSFTNWCRGEPNNGFFHDQHCMQMNFSDEKCWDDIWCGTHLPFVCMKKL
ncbi:ladderlectin-like [Poeciliopsis prolifica]|uniref:ladderlectin-like n=1 Tax=Poeciliopsis prolifica TaxID=188132 RepID=UPI002413EB35|nr:ladderlectin-like [Poeciliopsis prolifica]